MIYVNNLYCGLKFEKTVNYRLAYSFCAGDSLTLTLSPDKTILPFWGFRHNDNATDTEETLSFIKNLTTFYNDKGHEYLLSSKRIIGKKFISNKVTFTCWGRKSDAVLDKILSSAYEKKNGDKVQIFVNPFTNEEKIILDNKSLIIPALSVLEIKI